MYTTDVEIKIPAACSNTDRKYHVYTLDEKYFPVDERVKKNSCLYQITNKHLLKSKMVLAPPSYKCPLSYKRLP